MTVDHTAGQAESLPLQELHDEYVERVNIAVAEGRDDQAHALASAFEDEVLHVLLAR